MAKFMCLCGMAALWVAKGMEVCLELICHEGFFREPRMGNGLIIIQHHINARGSFLQLSNFWNGRRKGLLVILEGANGIGWKGFLHPIQSIIGSKAAVMNHANKGEFVQTSDGPTTTATAQRVLTTQKDQVGTLGMKAQQESSGCLVDCAVYLCTIAIVMAVAGAMLGDAFLHQLPHAFGGEHSHSHDHHADNAYDAHSSDLLHSHSLKDLSVGMSILAGIVVFLLVEKAVRYVEDNSGGTHGWSHGHHHHHDKSSKKLKGDNDAHDIVQSQSLSGKRETMEMSTEGKVLREVSNDSSNGDDQHEFLRKRSTGGGAREDKAIVDTTNSFTDNSYSKEKDPARSSTNLVFGYLNLFSDGVHNFTDGMALGSAFLLYGSVGGWSRTLFLLAHELPQEIGDFGILVRSGFSVSRALFFNFLSALVALAGTAMALLLGQDPGQSSFIEGFTAGGFIYIAVAGVLAEMNNNAKSSLKCTAIHISSLILGMGVALWISLVE